MSPTSCLWPCVSIADLSSPWSPRPLLSAIQTPEPELAWSPYRAPPQCTQPSALLPFSPVCARSSSSPSSFSSRSASRRYALRPMQPSSICHAQSISSVHGVLKSDPLDSWCRTQHQASSALYPCLYVTREWINSPICPWTVHIYSSFNPLFSLLIPNHYS
jgi:hypothetical protein